ncbi:MAG TPA: hypothetical protein VD962_04450 [Rubricoccaceae bacterium]|nr:hypothetical protein [Rubricoccaceae bacterium]
MRTLLVLSLLFLAAGCAPAYAPGPAPGGSEPVIDGVVVVGAWDAVEVLGDPEATRDLERDVLVKTLTITAGGRVTLSGVDRRAGGGTQTYRGQLDGRRVTFEGLSGSAILRVVRGRLHLEDPFGVTTVYRRISG